MFQSSDEKDIDEIFLNYDFDIPRANNDSNKRNSDEMIDQPVKKKCIDSPDNKTLNILSIIQSKTSQTRIDKPKTNCYVNKSTANINSESVYSVIPERCRKIIQRKFPGPAGILPENKELNINIKTLEEFESLANNKTLESDEILCSQLSEDVFKKGPWLKMLLDWSPTNSKIYLPEIYTVSWTKSKAIAKKLIGQKTPFLAVIIQTIDSSNKDPMILLKDKTGEIQATLLHEAWEKYDEFLLPGSVIILKQTSVLSTLKRQYLSITLNNIISIYCEQNKENSKTVEVIENQPMTVDQVIKTIEKTKQHHKTQKILQKIQPVDNKSYLKIINNENEAANKFYFSKNSPKFNENCGKSSNKIEVNSSSSTSKNDEKSNKNLEEENVVLSKVLEGLDANLLFDDF